MLGADTIVQPLLPGRIWDGGGCGAEGAGGGNISGEPSPEGAEAGALSALLLALGRTAWFLGFAAVPAAAFWAGCTAWDGGHGVYLLLLMGPMLMRTLRLQPLVPSPCWSNRAHSPQQLYICTHICVCVCVRAGLIPRGLLPKVVITHVYLIVTYTRFSYKETETCRIFLLRISHTLSKATAYSFHII